MNNVKPFFSICIPQYRRPEHLICALQALVGQTMQDFEVCISDDGSPEVEFFKLKTWLESSGLKYNLVRQSGGLRYDKNLRSALSLATGRYCLLMGNDDSLKNQQTLAQLKKLLESSEAALLIANFSDWTSGIITERIQQTQLLEGSTILAARLFRNQAFVSGLILKTSWVNKLYSDCVDGSEMYQMYLFSAVLSAGEKIQLLKKSIVRKDIQIKDKDVDSYVTVKEQRAGFADGKKLPMLRICDTVMKGISTTSELKEAEKWVLIKTIIKQLYSFTYRFWLVEYRRIGRTPVALGLAWSMRPVFLAQDVGRIKQFALYPMYCYVLLTGLLMPVRLFDYFKSTFYRLAKKVKL